MHATPTDPYRIQTPPPPGRGTDLWLYFRRIAEPLWQGLFTARLSPRERMAYSGDLFGGAPTFVAAAADALSAAPDLFADVPISGRALRADHDEALDLLFLSHRLQELSELAYDAYLRKHSGAIKVAMAVMAQQRKTATLPFRSDDEQSKDAVRRCQLVPAQNVLTARQERKRRKAQRNFLRLRS